MANVLERLVAQARVSLSGWHRRGIAVRETLAWNSELSWGFTPSDAASVRLADPVLGSDGAQGERAGTNVVHLFSRQGVPAAALGMQETMRSLANELQVGDSDAALVAAEMVDDMPFGDRSMLQFPDNAMGVSTTLPLASCPSIRTACAALPYMARRLVSAIFDGVRLGRAVGVPAYESSRLPGDVSVAAIARTGNGSCLSAATFTKARRVHLGSPVLLAVLGWSAGETKPAPDCTIGGA